MQTDSIYVVHRGQPNVTYPVCSRIDLTGDGDLWLMDVDGERIGDVRKGANRRWFHVPEHRSGEASPLDGLDNLSRTGVASLREAAVGAAGGLRVLDGAVTPYAAECMAMADERIAGG